MKAKHQLRIKDASQDRQPEIQSSLREQLKHQNLEFREAHQRSLTEMEESRKFQSSAFDTMARRKFIEDQDTILELSGRIQELQNEINCMSDSKEFQDAESIRSGNSTLPVDQCHSHLIQFLKDCKAVLLECRAAGKGRQAFGTHMENLETFFCKSRCVIIST